MAQRGFGLLCCSGPEFAALMAMGDADMKAVPQCSLRDLDSAFTIVGAVRVYIALFDKPGLLRIAPLGLLAMFRMLQMRWWPALVWAVAGTLLVHVASYKLLCVPLPWGVLRPFH